MKDLVICVLGGMGTYATINLFKQYAEVFPAEKEWESPESLSTIDVRCQAELGRFSIMKMWTNCLMK